MFGECSKTSKDECFLSVLKLVKVNFAECTKTSKGECLLNVLKPGKMNLC